jgi:hypothetical protein
MCFIQALLYFTERYDLPATKMEIYRQHLYDILVIENRGIIMVEGSSKGNLAELGEQLKQVLESVQDNYETFIDDAQLYKKGNVDDVNFLYKLSEYLIDLTKVNFLEARFVLELRSLLEARGAKGQAETHQSSISEKVPLPTIAGEDRLGASQSKRICNHCSAEISSKAKFCRSCGKSQ